MNEWRGEIVRNAAFAADLAVSKLTPDKVLCQFWWSHIGASFMGMQVGSVAHQHTS